MESTKTEIKDMDEVNISRRVFIGASVFLVSVPLVGCIFDAEKEILAAVEKGQYFSASDMTLLMDVAEIMIPKTETPGATDAHVIPVLDGLMLTWAGTETKKQYNYVIQQIDALAKSSFGSNYTSLDKPTRTTLVTELDKSAFANKDTDLSKSYRKLKQIIFHVYYTSEEANPDFMLVPGTYRGCVTKADIDRFNAQGRVDNS